MQNYNSDANLGVQHTGVSMDKEAMRNHLNQKVLVIDDVDKQIWELVTTVPRLNKGFAVGFLFLNLLLPGFGTIAAACAANENVSKTQMVIGVFQFFTSFVLIGYIWAIYWSYLSITKAW